MERAILARHGESEYSVRGALNGDVTAPCGLTATGVEQARRLGDDLRGEQIDLCVTSAFERTRATADEALRHRPGPPVPRLVVPDLNDPLYGPFEGAQIEDYRAWAGAAASSEAPEPGGESRREIVARYTRAFRMLLDRPERTVLVVVHSLPVGYALGARDGVEPAARVQLADYATPHPFAAVELTAAAALLERWLAAPGW
jgi:broad specificity phosphatase PhoE